MTKLSVTRPAWYSDTQLHAREDQSTTQAQMICYTYRSSATNQNSMRRTCVCERELPYGGGVGCDSAYSNSKAESTGMSLCHNLAVVRDVVDTSNALTGRRHLT